MGHVHPCVRSSTRAQQNGCGLRCAQVLEVEFAALEDKKLRSQLKNPQDIEAQTTALQIASLRRIGSSTKVVLLDRYGPQAEAVAKELSKKGYGKVRKPEFGSVLEGTLPVG